MPHKRKAKLPESAWRGSWLIHFFRRHVRDDPAQASTHYRLFCLLERGGASLGLGGPSIVIIAGKDKPFKTVLSAADYADVRALGTEFRSRNPRSIER